MLPNTVYCAGTTPALAQAARFLREKGFVVTDTPQWDVGHLLLDVPSFRPGSPLAEPGKMDTLLGALPRNITVWGGGLSHPALEDYTVVDLLKDETYLARNAAITACCALQAAAPYLQTTWTETPTLILGWGRIGKCLGRLLRSQDCPVTIASGSEEKRGALASLGYDVLDSGDLLPDLPRYRLIFNTAPRKMLSREDLAGCTDCVKIDLASEKGLGGEDVIWARGLPGIHAPESSGRLIAETCLRLGMEGEK